MACYHPTAERPFIYAWTVFGLYIGCRAFATKASALRYQRQDHMPGHKGLVLDTRDKVDKDTWHTMALVGRAG